MKRCNKTEKQAVSHNFEWCKASITPLKPMFLLAFIFTEEMAADAYFLAKK